MFPDINTFGMGLSHMAKAPDHEPCERCHDTGLVGDPTFPLLCPECRAVTSTGHDAGE
jgi:hypothetical protein